MKKVYILAMLIITAFATAQVKKTTTGAKPPVTTALKQTTYPSVTIGNQVWMSKNLDVSTFSNGDPIPQAQSIAEWKKASNQKKPAWCYYQVQNYSETKYFGEPDKSKKYGKLYNWYAVSDPRGLAPKGWHIPSLNEWRELFQYVENNINHVEFRVDQDVANALNSKSGWGAPGIKGYNYNPKYLQGTDLFGFNVLPGGLRLSDSNHWGFENIGEEANFFINEEPDRYRGDVDIYSIEISDTNYRFDIPDQNSNGFGLLGPGEGLSVRCVKAKEYEPTAQDYFNNGTTKFNAKDYNGAIEEFSKAIELSPDSFLCYYNRGNMKGWLNKWDEAKIDFEKAWKLVQSQNMHNDSTVKNILFGLGNAYYNSNSETSCFYFNEALKYGSEEAKQFVKKCNEAKINELIKSGGIKRINKDFIGAIEDFKMSIELSPNKECAFCLTEKAYTECDMEDWNSAVLDYSLALKIMERDNHNDDSKANTLVSLGYAYVKLNKVDTACYYFYEAIKYGHKNAQTLIDKYCK